VQFFVFLSVLPEDKNCTFQSCFLYCCTQSGISNLAPDQYFLKDSWKARKCLSLCLPTPSLMLFLLYHKVSKDSVLCFHPAISFLACWFVCMYVCVCICGAEDQTQGLAQATQVFYYWSAPPMCWFSCFGFFCLVILGIELKASQRLLGKWSTTWDTPSPPVLCFYFVF
jgi:hypothetical protein